MMIPADAPDTLEDAIDVLIASMASDEIAHIRDPASHSGEQHMWAGMSLRNRWKLWHDDSVLGQHFRTRFGLGCGDDMSAMILEGVWCKARGTPYDADKHALYFHDFWQRQRRDPITQAELPPPPPRGPRPSKPSLPPRGRYQDSVLDRVGRWLRNLVGGGRLGVELRRDDAFWSKLVR